MSRLRLMLASRVAAKNEDLRVEQLTHIRDFAHWLKPIDITLYNTWVSREGIDASHAFTYKLRQDLTAGEKKLMDSRQRGFHGDDSDVFAIVKPYMHTAAIKKPVLVLPKDRADRITDRCPGVLVEEDEISTERRDEILSLADVLEQQQYNLKEAAKALRAMIFEPPPPIVCPAPWLSQDEAAPVAVLPDTGNHMFPHLPDTSWDLLARFHRGDVPH